MNDLSHSLPLSIIPENECCSLYCPREHGYIVSGSNGHLSWPSFFDEWLNNACKEPPQKKNISHKKGGNQAKKPHINPVSTQSVLRQGFFNIRNDLEGRKDNWKTRAYFNSTRRLGISSPAISILASLCEMQLGGEVAFSTLRRDLSIPFNMQMLQDDPFWVVSLAERQYILNTGVVCGSDISREPDPYALCFVVGEVAYEQHLQMRWWPCEEVNTSNADGSFTTFLGLVVPYGGSVDQ